MHDHKAQKWNEQILAEVHAFTILNESIFADREEKSWKQDFKLHDKYSTSENVHPPFIDSGQE